MSLKSASILSWLTPRSIRRFGANKDGVAAVEFAMILPLMLALLMGAVELCQAITANRRVSQVGSTAGDLVARASTNIYDSTTPVVDPGTGANQITVNDIMKASSWLMQPFLVDANNRLTVEVSVVSSSATSETDTKQKWVCKYDSAVGTTTACTCPNFSTGGKPYTLPTGTTSTSSLVTKSDSVVVAKVEYGYRPVFFNFSNVISIFGARLGGAMAAGNGGYSPTYKLTETVYLKPRAVCPTLNTPNNAGACGC